MTCASKGNPAPCRPRPSQVACGPRALTGLSSILAIVEDYVARHRPRSRLAFYADQPSLECALDAVASWKAADGKVLPHQRRVSRAAKANAGDQIRTLRVDDVADFEHLFQRVQRAIGSIRGIGSLAVYDASLRIGAFLGKLPERVYLQRGARTGARALGVDARQRSLPIEVFPAEFRHLEPWEIEDVLCLYKDELAGIQRQAAA